MAKLEKLVPGQVLYTVTKQRAGNTTIYRKAIHKVTIISVHPDHVIASWNCNPQKKYFSSEIAKWKVNNPAQNSKQNMQGIVVKSDGGDTTK